MGNVHLDTEITEAINAFRLRAPRRNIKAVDVAALPCRDISVDGAKAAELCPVAERVRRLEAGLKLLHAACDIDDDITSVHPRILHQMKTTINNFLNWKVG